MADLDYDEVSPHACQWIATKATLKSISTSTYRQRLDGLRIPNVCWMPYGEHRPVREFDLISCFSGQLRWGSVVVRHWPERVMRQFRYVQRIPTEAVDLWVSFEGIDDRWMYYSDHLAPAGEICVVPRQGAPEYMDRFFLMSHPFMTMAQPSNSPWHPPATQDASFVEPHIPQVP